MAAPRYFVWQGGFLYADRPPYLDHKLSGSLGLVSITIIAGSARWESKLLFLDAQIYTSLPVSQQSLFLFEPSLPVFRFNNLIWIPVKNKLYLFVANDK
jgi:hypothetical protein